MASLTKQKLLSALEAAAPARGLGLVDLELSGFGRTKSAALVRVYLEKSETGGSPDIDELAEANVWIEELIDQLDPEQGSYTLEVSSPGLDRRLRTLEHFQRFIGAQVKLKTTPIDGRSNWTGRLLAVSGVTGESAADAADAADAAAATITLGLEEPGATSATDGSGVNQALIPIKQIKKANIQAEISFTKGKGQ